MFAMPLLVGRVVFRPDVASAPRERSAADVVRARRRIALVGRALGVVAPAAVVVAARVVAGHAGGRRSGRSDKRGNVRVLCRVVRFGALAHVGILLKELCLSGFRTLVRPLEQFWYSTQFTNNVNRGSGVMVFCPILHFGAVFCFS